MHTALRDRSCNPYLLIPLTGEFPGVERALSFLQSKAEHVSHSDSYGFCLSTTSCQEEFAKAIPGWKKL
jgi:hypothetical protein